MRQIIFDGRLGKDGAEMRQTKNGKPYARFSVANRTYSNGEEKTEWFDVTWFDPNEKMVEHMTSGSYVIVTGTIRFEQKIDDKGRMWLNFYVNATNVDWPSLGKRQDNGDNGGHMQDTYNRQPSVQSQGYQQQPQVQYQQQPQVQYQRSVTNQAPPTYGYGTAQQQPQVTGRPQQQPVQERGQSAYYQTEQGNSGRTGNQQSMLDQRVIDPNFYSKEVPSTVPGATERIVEPQRIQLPDDDPARGMAINDGDTDDLPF